MKYNDTDNVLNCVDTRGYDGVRTVFVESNRMRKSRKHPELRRLDFIERIKEVVETPNFVYEDLDKINRRAYYGREYKINSRVRYTKVVVLKLKALNIVITAYRPDYVKERGKTKLIYGTDND